MRSSRSSGSRCRASSRWGSARAGRRFSIQIAASSRRTTALAGLRRTWASSALVRRACRNHTIGSGNHERAAMPTTTTSSTAGYAVTIAISTGTTIQIR